MMPNSDHVIIIYLQVYTEYIITELFVNVTPGSRQEVYSTIQLLVCIDLWMSHENRRQVLTCGITPDSRNVGCQRNQRYRARSQCTMYPVQQGTSEAVQLTSPTCSLLFVSFGHTREQRTVEAPHRRFELAIVCLGSNLSNLDCERNIASRADVLQFGGRFTS